MKTLIKYKDATGDWKAIFSYRHKGKYYTDLYIYNFSCCLPCFERFGHYEFSHKRLMKLLNIQSFNRVWNRKKIKRFLKCCDYHEYPWN